MPYVMEKLKLFGQRTRLLGGAVVKILPASAGDSRDVGSTPGLERFSGVGKGNQFQYSCLENSMDRGAWWVTVHRVVKSWTWLSEHTHTH